MYWSFGKCRVYPALPLNQIFAQQQLTLKVKEE